jgi:hypothetical protein
MKQRSKRGMNKREWVVCITNNPAYDAGCRRGDFGKIVDTGTTDLQARWLIFGCRQWVLNSDCVPFSIKRVITELLKRRSKSE